jgi:hypothetical protein
MGDRKFIVYPADPFWRPTESQKEEIRSFFFEEVSPTYDNEYCHTFDLPYLVGNGEKSWILCPRCGAKLRQFTKDYDRTDYFHWWDKLSMLPGTSTTEMPCCGGVAKILELKFSDNDGYACFFLGALEPDCYNGWWYEPSPSEPELLGAVAVAKIEKILGTQIKQLWVYGT